MPEYTIEEIENICFQALCAQPGIYLSQYDIISYVFNTMDVKDPCERDRIKMRVMMILRCIHNTFDCINYITKNSNIYVSFSPDDFDDKAVRIKDLNIDSIKESINTEKEAIPKDIEIINFILDENLTDYINKKSENDNTILHSLVINNDYFRIKKHFDKLKKLLFIKNSKDETPLDLIKDARISSILILELINDNINIRSEIINSNKRINELELFVSTNNYVLHFVMLCMFIFYVYYIKYG